MCKIKIKAVVVIFLVFFLANLAFAGQNESVLNNLVNETPLDTRMIELPVEPINETSLETPIVELPVDPVNETFLEKPLIEQPLNETSIEEPIIEPPINETELQPIEGPTLIKTLLNLIADKFTVIVGDVINIHAFLTYENQTPLPDKKIDFYADELIGSDVTDNEGKAEIQWNTSTWLPKAYTITANYTGDGELAPVSMGVNIEIQDNNTGLENRSLNNTTILNDTVIYWDTPQFPFQNKSSNEPFNLSNLRPELIKDNREISEIMSELRDAGYYVRSVNFGLDKNGFYVLAALVKTKSGNYDAESKEVFEILQDNGYADYYGVEIFNIPKEKFVDYKVPKAILNDFLSNKIKQEKFNSDAGAGVKILPPPHPTFINRRVTENIQMITR